MLGYDSGHVDKYNIQSGLHRGTLSQAEQGGPAHPGANIRGICSDGLNQVSLKSKLKNRNKFQTFKVHPYGFKAS